MSHKHKKKRSEEKAGFNELSWNDRNELTLLYIQLNAIMVLIYSDLMFYFAVVAAINEVLTKDGSKRDGYASDRLLIKYSMSGLWVYIYITIVSIARYNSLKIRKRAGEFKYSIMPNLLIAIGGLLNIVAYSYFYKGSNDFFRRDVGGFSFVTNNTFKEVLDLLNTEKNAMVIRFYADYFFFRTTIESIAVIISRYNKELRSFGVPNPDISALSAQSLYIVSRVIIAKTAVQRLNIVVNNVSDQYKYNGFIDGEILSVYGNYYGIISNIFLYIGFYKIYERNIIQPVFGG